MGGAISVWLAPEARLEQSQLDEFEHLLDETERLRASRFRLEADRCRFVAAHVLVRAALSAVRPATPPIRWRFSGGTDGTKPRPLASDGTPVERLEFSLTHCDGLVAVAVAEGYPIGLDAEPVRRPDLTTELARVTFAPVETEARSLSPLHLARLWCGKEAFAKAVGLGLAIDFAQVVLNPETGDLLMVPPDVAPGSWRIRFITATPGFVVALAWGGPDRLAIKIKDGITAIKALVADMPGNSSERQ